MLTVELPPVTYELEWPIIYSVEEIEKFDICDNYSYEQRLKQEQIDHVVHRILRFLRGRDREIIKLYLLGADLNKIGAVLNIGGKARYKLVHWHFRKILKKLRERFRNTEEVWYN